jgi:hypothetical protein
MGDVVNLRQQRKREARAAAEKAAAANRVKFGQPRRERERAAAEKQRAGAELDGKKLNPPD